MEKYSIDQSSLYERIGGEAAFTKLAANFYVGVASSVILRPLYPDDLDGAQERLRLFLMQYWGGPKLYSELRGHPRLRMRHAPYVIGELERTEWLRCMMAAIDTVEMKESDRIELTDYLVNTAQGLMNAP